MLLVQSLYLATSFALVAAIPQFDSPEDIPLCAYNPIQSVINGVGCQVTETSCFCVKPNIVPSFASAVVPACNGEVNSAEVSSFASSFCVINSSATTTTKTSRRGPTPTPAGVTITSDDSNTSGASSTLSRTRNESSTPRATGAGTSRPAASVTTTTPAATAVPSDESGGSPNLGVSALALAIAVGGMTWIFSEL